MGLILLINLVLFYSSQNSESDKNTILIGLSLLLLLFSLWLFIRSFYISDQDVIDLEIPSRYKSRKGNIEIGKVIKKNRRRYKFFLSIKDLERHMFVCGITGSGKSNFVQNFLIKFKERYDIPFLLAEFKGEYTFLQDIIEDLLIIRPGENFSINIFNPEGANPDIHAERLFDILKSGQFLDANSEFSPQMEKVLVDILTNVCSNPQYQSWKGFFDQCEEYLKNQKNYIPMLHQSLVSIQNRIRRFSLGPLKSIFAKRYKLKIKDLFDKNILFDLSSIIRLGGEKEDALFFLNMVLKYLWDKNLTYGAYNFKGIKHLTIIEDTQYFAPKDLSLQTKLTSYLEDIALLQRGTGECLISIATRPNVSEEILANCGVLITFKNHMQRSFISELLNLDEENEDYLSILEEGECIVRTNSIKRPFLLWVPLVERYWLKRGDVNRKNKLILKKFKEKNTEMIKNNETSNYYVDKSKKDAQKIQYTENEDDDIRDATEIKFFIDNLLAGDENAKENFNPENYRKCPECYSIIEIKHKICPYCGSISRI
ncbi:MAG: helicase HerA domain-containing protein [Promethearchaeota archaeon]